MGARFMNGANDVGRVGMAEDVLMSDAQLQAVHLAQVGRAKHGVLVHVDGLPQSELNHLQRAIAVVLQSGGELERGEANALLQHLASRAQIVAQVWGSANPSEFARALKAVSEGPARDASLLEGLALLYRPSRLAPYAKQWIDEHYRSLPVGSWNEIVARLRTRMHRRAPASCGD